MEKEIKEFKELGEKLKELCEKHGEDYFTLTYIDGSIMGNNNPHKERSKIINIYIGNEKENEEDE